MPNQRAPPLRPGPHVPGSTLRPDVRLWCSGSVRPATVIAWHRRGFRTVLGTEIAARGSTPTRGRAHAPHRTDLARKPPLEPSEDRVRTREAWSLRRQGHGRQVHGEASGAAATSAFATWKTFVRNYLAGAIAIDFLTVPTVTFDIVYVFFVLSLERRRVLRMNVTAHPRAAWAAQQIVEAIGAEIVPERLIRDRDAIFGAAFDARVDNLGVRQILIAPRSPWQNGYAERWVGTLRRDPPGSADRWTSRGPRSIAHGAGCRERSAASAAHCGGPRHEAGGLSPARARPPRPARTLGARMAASHPARPARDRPSLAS